jgi:lipid-A-disaccharide synthase-like uncharacterized protein
MSGVFLRCIRVLNDMVTMVEKLVLLLGFIGQSMFGARTIAQWIYSEREGRTVSPTIFWVLSVIGALLFLIYGMIRSDVVIIVGQTIAFYIYVRNLQLKGVWVGLSLLLRIVILIAPWLIILHFALLTDFTFENILLATDPGIFLTVGMIGQLLLNFRYFYQWYFSEKAGESILPLGFWVISAFASVMVVIYALNRWDPVLLVAQAGGLVAYLRNIYFHMKPRNG